jgi:hypothetical protein
MGKEDRERESSASCRRIFFPRHKGTRTDLFTRYYVLLS